MLNIGYLGIVVQLSVSAGPRSAGGSASDSEPEVPGSIPGPAAYFRLAFR